LYCGVTKMKASASLTAADHALTYGSAYGEEGRGFGSLAGMVAGVWESGESCRGKVARSWVVRRMCEGMCGVRRVVIQVEMEGPTRGVRVEQMIRAMVFWGMVGGRVDASWSCEWREVLQLGESNRDFD
jgi:hypothetical protein